MLSGRFHVVDHVHILERYMAFLASLWRDTRGPWGIMRNYSNYWDDGKGGAVYNVFRFGTKGQASRFYARYSRLSPYSEHSGLSLASQIADEYQAGCGYSKFDGYRCLLYARYEEFVISLNVTINAEMTFEQFEKVADYLDEEMWRLLSKEIPDSTPAD